MNDKLLLNGIDFHSMLMVVMVVQLFYALYSNYLNFNLNGISKYKMIMIL